MENVLLTKDDPPVVKVADFGLAKYIDSLTMLKVSEIARACVAPADIHRYPSDNVRYPQLPSTRSCSKQCKRIRSRCRQLERRCYCVLYVSTQAIVGFSRF